MSGDNIREKIAQADMVLVGLGEEFQCPAGVKNLPEYKKGCELLRNNDCLWLMPAWDDFCSRLAGVETASVLEKLAGLLAEKNYFVVSVAMNDCIAQAPWKRGRLVMPCGSSQKLQCSGGCDEEPIALTESEKELLKEIMQGLYRAEPAPEKPALFGNCESCGAARILNNIYAENYNEKGYLEQWGLYTKWLQGTLNRKVLILELGVGMKFPTVIRFPFEKVAYFNQKAEFYRINEKLYQMTEELHGKGCGISQNAIDWLRNL